MKTTRTDPPTRATTWAVAFLLGRFAMLLALPPTFWQAFTDIPAFYLLAQAPGWPLVHSWVEFPPLYPWLAELLYGLARGREPTFALLHALAMTLFHAGNVYLMARMAIHLNVDNREPRLALYTVLHVGLLYTWGYFDVMALFFLLLALWWGTQARWVRAGLALAFGGLTKWFPLVLMMALPLRRRDGWKPLLAALAPVLALWALLGILAPESTAWSWQAQSQRAPWETPWALAYGRLRTGLLASYERTEPPRTDFQAPVWVKGAPWVLFLLLGALAWRWFPGQTPREWLQRSAWVLGAFFLTGWGYSPQWMLYTLPGFLLLLPWPVAGWWSGLWTLVHLLEWPLLLSRGWFVALWGLIPLRLLLLALGMALLVQHHARHTLAPEPPSGKAA